MSSSLKTYRVYCFDGREMTLTGELIEAASDADAIAIAQQQDLGSMCEIWEGKRLVAKLEGERRLA